MLAVSSPVIGARARCIDSIPLDVNFNAVVVRTSDRCRDLIAFFVQIVHQTLGVVFLTPGERLCCTQSSDFLNCNFHLFHNSKPQKTIFVFIQHGLLFLILTIYELTTQFKNVKRPCLSSVNCIILRGQNNGISFCFYLIKYND